MKTNHLLQHPLDLYIAKFTLGLHDPHYSFPFSIVRRQYLPKSIPPKILYISIGAEIPRTGRTTTEFIM